MDIYNIYNFIFNYEIKASFGAFLRFITSSFIIIFLSWHLRDILNFSHPNKIFSYANYRRFCEDKYPQISLFNIKCFGESILFHKLIFILFFVSGLSSALGLLTNFSIFIFMITFISIQSRVFPCFFSGGDVISRVLLLALLFTDCGAKYSMDYALQISSNAEVINGFFIRVVQLTICLGYITNAIRKLSNPSGYLTWIRGEAVKNAFLSGIWGRRLLPEFFKNKYIYRPMTYSVVLYELLSPLFFVNQTRSIILIFGLVFHMGTIIFMRLGFFGPMMLIALAFFANEYFK